MQKAPDYRKRRISSRRKLHGKYQNSLLTEKENVYLRGFGSFIVKHRAAKTARNILKKTTMKIGAHDQPSFKPAKCFIEEMKNATMEK